MLALLLCGCASAKPTRPEPRPQPAPADADCVLKHGSHDTLSLKQLPANIRDALTKLAGAMADRGEFFNATDFVVKPAPFKRFIRAGEAEGKWYVWYEHGGIAYWRQIVIFAIDSAGVVHIQSDVHARNVSLCETTDLLLHGNAP